MKSEIKHSLIHLAIKSTQLEKPGWEPPQALIRDMEAFLDHHITADEVIEAIKERHYGR